MRFQLNTRPPAIVLGLGGDQGTITLEHKYLTASERMTALEAMSAGGLAAGASYLAKFIDGWTGIENEHGDPIPFPKMPDDSRVNPILDAVLGRLPVAKQLELVIKQLGANGVNFKQFEGLLAELVDETTAEEVGRSADPLSSPPKPAPTKS